MIVNLISLSKFRWKPKISAVIPAMVLTTVEKLVLLNGELHASTGPSNAHKDIPGKVLETTTIVGIPMENQDLGATKIPEMEDGAFVLSENVMSVTKVF